MTSSFVRKNRSGGAAFIDIEDIRDGLIHLKGGRYRSIITADPINFSLLSDEEQESVEGAFGNFLMGLSFPVQFLVHTRPVDMRDTLQELRKNLSSLPQNMVEYEAELEKFLSYFAGQIMITETYMVVPFDGKRGSYEKARGELMRRCRVVIEGLSKCGLNPRMLDTNELLQFLFSFFNKDSTVRIKDLIQLGALELYKKGGSRVDRSKEKEENT